MAQAYSRWQGQIIPVQSSSSFPSSSPLLSGHRHGTSINIAVPTVRHITVQLKPKVWVHFMWSILFLYIYLGLWGQGDLTDLEHPFLELFLRVCSDVERYAYPHRGILCQGENIRPAAFPFGTNIWREKKKKKVRKREPINGSNDGFKKVNKWGWCWNHGHTRLTDHKQRKKTWWRRTTWEEPKMTNP